MVIIEWDSFDGEQLNEDVAIQMSNHAVDRSFERYGKPVYISKFEVEKAIKSVSDKLKSYSDKFKTFVVKTKDKLNIVGELKKRGENLIFKVITLMRKDNFKPNNSRDKIIMSETYLIKNKRDDGSKQIQDIMDQINVIKAEDNFKDRKPFSYGNTEEWTVLHEQRKRDIINQLLKN